MKYSKIILAGGSGYLGEVLINHFKSITSKIVVLSRAAHKVLGNVEYIHWNARTAGPWMQELEGADLLVNLTGKSVNCRYNETNRAEILNSRLDSVRILETAISSCTHPPKYWVQCASATIYRDARDHSMTEDGGEYGKGFSVEVCHQWEQAFSSTKTPGTIKKLLRIALVLGKKDGVYPRLKMLAKAGLGGQQGDGKMMVSWIHEEDFARSVEWMMSPRSKQHVYNCSSPFPIQNRGFMKQVRTANHVLFGIPSPEWMLKIGAWLIGTETELIFKSRWVIPDRLLAEGFEFNYPHLCRALHAIECQDCVSAVGEHINTPLVEK